MSSLREAAAALIGTLERLGFRYAIGGSFASSLHGVARATQDIDLVVDLPLPRVRELYSAVAADFYADEETMLDAIRRGRPFNLIHLASGLKFDIFAASAHPIGREQLSHRLRLATALLGGDPLEVQVVSAEDIVLAKLLWYRDGGEVSERQWNDLVNLMQIQRNRLDLEYLRAQAERLGVATLLNRLADQR
ncbi:MAG: nucleotidyl transferase AbiEii/AbiGii toxin family protein [Bryobacteraceae bacterium]